MSEKTAGAVGAALDDRRGGLVAARLDAEDDHCRLFLGDAHRAHPIAVDRKNHARGAGVVIVLPVAGHGDGISVACCGGDGQVTLGADQLLVAPLADGSRAPETATPVLDHAITAKQLQKSVDIAAIDGSDHAIDRGRDPDAHGPRLPSGELYIMGAGRQPVHRGQSLCNPPKFASARAAARLPSRRRSRRGAWSPAAGVDAESVIGAHPHVGRPDHRPATHRGGRQGAVHQGDRRGAARRTGRHRGPFRQGYADAAAGWPGHRRVPSACRRSRRVHLASLASR